ncbi:hypothetical protein HRbin24_00359 [bacterium HR24]|nr:hypothetical protein HRbin24_00359 [bacterium HR24]
MSEREVQERPLPRPTRISAPFWRGAAEGKLLLQRCRRCGLFIYYPRPFCPRCLAEELEWHEASGRGRVYTYTVVRRAATPAFAAMVPYVLAIVELEEGPRLVTNIVGCRPEEVRVEMPVRATFERLSDEVGLVLFRPDGMETDSADPEGQQ